MRWFYIIMVLILSLSCEEDRLVESEFGSVTGKVLGSESNLPLVNVKISTSPQSSVVFTDVNGDYILSNVPIGVYSLQANKDDYVASFESVDVNAGLETVMVFELEKSSANNSSPAKPLLLLPTNNSTGDLQQVMLDWETTDVDNDDLTYTLKVYNEDNFDVVNVEDLSDSSYELSGLKFNTKYFWQVSVSDGINEPVLSDVFNFTTLEYPNNRTFYVKKVNGNNVIYSRSDAGLEYQLTSESENSWRPRKAVGANKIAFLKTDGAQVHLYIMDLDGGNHKKVTSSVPVNGFNLEELDFEWKSNNSQLIYSNFDKLYQINESGGGLSLIYKTVDGKFITEIDWNEQTQRIALKVNDNQGYGVSIFVIDLNGVVLSTVLGGVNGAAGGLDFNFTGTKVLFTHDISLVENTEYRQLNSNIYVYDIPSSTSSLISQGKLSGTNDFDPKFSPNESSVIFANTSNDGSSDKNIYSVSLDAFTRTLIVEGAYMPDWK